MRISCLRTKSWRVTGTLYREICCSNGRVLLKRSNLLYLKYLCSLGPSRRRRGKKVCRWINWKRILFCFTSGESSKSRYNNFMNISLFRDKNFMSIIPNATSKDLKHVNGLSWWSYPCTSQPSEIITTSNSESNIMNKPDIPSQAKSASDSENTSKREDVSRMRETWGLLSCKW